MSTTGSREENLAVTAHRLLGAVSLIADKAAFLRQHRNEVDDELCDRWLLEIEANARDLSHCLGLLARGLIADLPRYCPRPPGGGPGPGRDQSSSGMMSRAARTIWASWSAAIGTSTTDSAPASCNNRMALAQSRGVPATA